MDNVKNNPVITATFESTNIKYAEYDPYMKVLSVWFHGTNETQYDYIGVEKELFDNFIIAESAGKFFNLNIKNKYETMNRAKRRKKRM